MKLSVIVPCKNEAGNVAMISKSLKDSLGKIDYEIIFIDDGSTDKTLNNIKRLYEEDPNHIKCISFSRNFKKEAAIYAGLSHASGEYTCIIDGDMQQNPGYLVKMFNFLEENQEYDQVCMVMKARKGEKQFMKLCKKMFYKIINGISDVNFKNKASDFRMFRRNVLEAILSLQENNRFTKGIFAWIGFNTKYMEYDVAPRMSGKSNFGFKASMNYAIDGILGFSIKPLKISIHVGGLCILVSLIYFIVALIKSSLYLPNLLFIFMFLLFGLNFIFLGIIGEYLSKNYLETKNRPIYIAKEKIGFKEKNIL